MRKILFIVLMLLCLTACTAEITGTIELYEIE